MISYSIRINIDLKSNEIDALFDENFVRTYWDCSEFFPIWTSSLSRVSYYSGLSVFVFVGTAASHTEPIF